MFESSVRRMRGELLEAFRDDKNLHKMEACLINAEACYRQHGHRGFKRIRDLSWKLLARYNVPGAQAHIVFEWVPDLRPVIGTYLLGIQCPSEILLSIMELVPELREACWEKFKQDSLMNIEALALIVINYEGKLRHEAWMRLQSCHRIPDDDLQIIAETVPEYQDQARQMLAAHY